MSDDHLLLKKQPADAIVSNVAVMGATVPELLAEIERRGVSLPEVSFQLIQSLSAHRSSRWNVNTGNSVHERNDKRGWYVLNAIGDTIAEFYGQAAHAAAQSFANPGFTIFERAAEVAGEVGELVNAVKKLRRHDMKMPGNYKPGEADRNALLKHAAYEIGDGFVTLYNLCNDLNIDAWECLQVAFNTKSDEMGFPEKL